MIKYLYYVLLALCLSVTVQKTWAKDNAVILLYHHVSTQTPPVTSVSPEVFRQHMAYLATHHQVVPLETVINALKNKQSLPDKAVAITFDDGYDNIYQNAHPILREFNFPYTVFVNPPLIGTLNYQMDWQQIKKMASEGATFANHGSYHDHLLTRHEQESDSQWLQRVMQDINTAEQQLEQQLGYSLKYFAYPYGEFDTTLKQALAEQGYVGFAQISGAVASYSDFAALPRYPAAGIYSSLNSLSTKLNSLAMPISNETPADPVLSLTTKPFTFAFDVDLKDIRARQVSCYVSDKPVSITVDNNRVSIPYTPARKAGRQRINCTAPSIADSSRYYWYSKPWFIPTSDGRWLD